MDIPDKFLNILLNILTPENIIIFSLLIFVLILVHIYMYKRKEKNLDSFVKEKIKVFKNVFYISEDFIIVLSEKNEILYTNEVAMNFFNMKKYSKDTILRVPKVKVKDEWIKLDLLIKNMNKKSDKRLHVFSNTELMLANSKESRFVNIYFNSTYFDSQRKEKCTILVIRDISGEKEQNFWKLKHKLTKLPNQRKAISDLNALYAKQHLDDQKIAIVVMNLDNFSTIRSIIGYEQSNQILVKFADYLSSISEEFSFSVYHTVHNNFLLVLSNVKNISEVNDVVKTIQSRLSSFYKMGKNNLHLTVSAGISIYPDRSTTYSLLDDSYKAFSSAEKRGDNQVVIYDGHYNKSGYDELTLYNGMHEGIKKGEFEVYYQAIVDAKDKKTVSAEALIRWQHPEFGIIGPDIFIPIMEKTGFIVELGKYVLIEVLKQQKRWELFKFRQVPIAINLSLLEFETKGFVESVTQKLAEHNVDPSLIKFEITEGSAMISEENTSRQLHLLKKLGIEISLDDFGTGYTSFSYLKKIPATILKVDRSLINGVLKREEDRRIVKAIIDLGHTLSMKIVVEGIENKELSEMMKDMGCDYMQGYHFHKPLPVFEFQELLR